MKHPIAHCLLEHCDTVLPLSVTSPGADNKVRIARERGFPIQHSLDNIPTLAAVAA